MNRIGKAIRDDEPYDEAAYEAWVLWHTNLIGLATDYIVDRLGEVQQGHRVEPARFHFFDPECEMSISSRPKTFDTTRQKLKRMSDTPLARIQDIAGIRIDGAFTLGGQDTIATAIEEELILRGATKVVWRDSRQEPHNGYRALHLHVTTDAGRIEVQIRTTLQSEWANLYEVVADVLGRGIRYDGEFRDSKDDLVRKLWRLSESIYMLERNLWRVSDACTASSSLAERVELDGNEEGLLSGTLARLGDVREELQREIERLEEQIQETRGSIKDIRDTAPIEGGS